MTAAPRGSSSESADPRASARRRQHQGARQNQLNAGTLLDSGGGSWVNAGLIKVVDAGSTVNLGGTFDNIAGTLNNAGTTITFSAATGSMQLNGGTLQFDAAAGLQFANNGNNRLAGVTVNGTLNVASRTGGLGYASFSGGLTVRDQAGVNVGTTAGNASSRLATFGTQNLSAHVVLGSGTSSGLLDMEGVGATTSMPWMS